MPFHTPEEQAKNQPQGQVQQQPQDQGQDLGQSLAGPQQVGASPSFRSAVDGFFQDPVNRAGLLSFGLNMLSGGFGTPLQQFAHAAGQGIESAAGAEAFQTRQDRLDEAQDFRERGLGQRAGLAREAQEGATQRANIAAKSRLAAAGVRGGNLANKAMSAFTNARAAKLKAMESVLDGDHNRSPEEQAELATQAGQEALDATIGAVRGNFPGALPPGQSRPNPAQGAAPPQVPQAPSAPGQSSTNQGAVPAPQAPRVALSSLQNSPNFQRALKLDQTPEGKLQLWNQGIVPSPPFTPPRSQADVLSGGQQQGTGNPLDALRQ